MAKIGAVILAAGMSKRMGKVKVLMPVNGIPMVQYPIRCALDHHLHPILVIGGKYIEEMKNSVGIHQGVQLIWNPNYESGMASSLKLAIQSVGTEVDAVLVFLADQPFVHHSVVHSLIEQYQLKKTDGIKIIRPAYNGVFGHPILFDRSLFEDFQAISGDQGGRSIIKKNSPAVEIISFQNQLWGMDIDTPEEYATMHKCLRQSIDER